MDSTISEQIWHSGERSVISELKQSEGTPPKFTDDPFWWLFGKLSTLSRWSPSVREITLISGLEKLVGAHEKNLKSKGEPMSFA